MLTVSTGIPGQKLYSRRFSTALSVSIVSALVWESASFYCEPMPDDTVEVRVAPEHRGVLDAIVGKYT